MKISVFSAISLDGFLADENGGIDWLDETPNPEGTDMGYNEFIKTVNAIVMGRNTFEKVLSFNIPWPYQHPVFVLSRQLHDVPSALADRVELVKGPIEVVFEELSSKGYVHFYVDGGQIIQQCLASGLMDQMILTTIPIILGKGIPLFGKMDRRLHFSCIHTAIYLGKIVQNHYIRDKSG